MKVLLLILLGVTLISCEYTEVANDCTCGTIISRGIVDDSYWLQLQNHCSGEFRIICLQNEVQWDSAYQNMNYCILNETW